jgi:hypothetical protein
VGAAAREAGMAEREPERAVRPGMRPGRGLWLAVTAVAVLAGVVVPYGVLGGGAPGLAIAGFWGLFGLVVVGLIVAGMAGWRD